MTKDKLEKYYLKKPVKDKNTINVPIYIKGEKRYIQMANYPMTEEHLANLEAVKQGLFTFWEMKGVLQCYHDDLQLIFLVLDKLTKTPEEKIERLTHFKIHYEGRYSRVPQKDKSFYIHHRQKLMQYLDERLFEEQQKHILNNIGSIKVTKRVKPTDSLLMNQEQLVIFFQFLQRVNIFDKEQVPNTVMSNVIELLTGYSEKKTRQLFSDNKEPNVVQKEAVISAVKKLLAELQKDS